MFDNPVNGGFVRTPYYVTNAHVLMADNSWRLRSEISNHAVRDFGGCAMLGSGQLVPIEKLKLD